MSASSHRECNNCSICLHCIQENIGLNIPGSICSCRSIHNACINCQNARFHIFSTTGRDSPPYRPPSQRNSPITVTNNTSLISEAICCCGSTICNICRGIEPPNCGRDCDICRRRIIMSNSRCNCTNGTNCIICITSPPI